VTYLIAGGELSKWAIVIPDDHTELSIDYFKLIVFLPYIIKLESLSAIKRDL